MNTPSNTEIDILQSFVKKKNTQDNKIALEAQKLVNLYRNLSVFRPSFINEFNQMLLSCSKEVQMMMSSIVGGPTVRQYLEYLQLELNQTHTDEQPEKTKTVKGYLPSPEEDITWNESQETISNSLTLAVQSLEESSKNQAILLEKTLKEFQQNLFIAKTESIHADTLKQIQQETLEKTLEKMVYLQTDLFSKMVAELSKTLRVQETHVPVSMALKTPSATHTTYGQAQTRTPVRNEATRQDHIPTRAPSFVPTQRKTIVPEIDDNVEILSEIDLSHK